MNNINMIFGAPGCGKTTRLMQILEDELKENDPDKIAFVSFTKKGSYEGRDRAIRKFNYKEKDFPYFRTIHSLAFRSMGMSKYDVINSKNYKEFSKALGMNFVGYYTEDLVNNDDKYLFFESLRKNNIKTAQALSVTLEPRKIKLVEHNYSRYKKHAGVKDFDDMIEDFLNKDEALPVNVAIIDEAQDLTTLQWEFCKVAFRDCKKVYIAGDDDQAIYEWSGADIEYFLSLTKGSKIHILDQSYRLKENILEYSKLISHKIKNRVDKNFRPVSGGGKIQFHNSIEEIEINSEQSYYFLSRNNYFLPKIKDYINKKGMTYFYKNKFSINLNTVKAILRYEAYRREGNIKSLMTDVLVKDNLRPDFTSFNPWYDVFNMEVDELNYYRRLFKNKTEADPAKCKITISTVHGVKGGEADNVVMIMDITKNVANSMDISMEAELRCLYVAFTRTKTNLHIINASSKHSYTDILKV